MESLIAFAKQKAAENPELIHKIQSHGYRAVSVATCLSNLNVAVAAFGHTDPVLMTSAALFMGKSATGFLFGHKALGVTVGESLRAAASTMFITQAAIKHDPLEITAGSLMLVSSAIGIFGKGHAESRPGAKLSEDNLISRLMHLVHADTLRMSGIVNLPGHLCVTLAGVLGHPELLPKGIVGAISDVMRMVSKKGHHAPQNPARAVAEHSHYVEVDTPWWNPGHRDLAWDIDTEHTPTARALPGLIVA